MNDLPIPKAELEAARLKFKRKLAALLIDTLAEAGVSITTVETRLGVGEGAFINYVTRLIQGGERGLDDLVDIATATGYEIQISAVNLHRFAEGLTDA